MSRVRSQIQTVHITAHPVLEKVVGNVERGRGRLVIDIERCRTGSFAFAPQPDRIVCNIHMGSRRTGPETAHLYPVRSSQGIPEINHIIENTHRRTRLAIDRTGINTGGVLACRQIYLYPVAGDFRCRAATVHIHPVVAVTIHEIGTNRVPGKTEMFHIMEINPFGALVHELVAFDDRLADLGILSQGYHARTAKIQADVPAFKIAVAHLDMAAVEARVPRGGSVENKQVDGGIVICRLPGQNPQTGKVQVVSPVVGMDHRRELHIAGSQRHILQAQIRSPGQVEHPFVGIPSQSGIVQIFVIIIGSNRHVLGTTAQ